MALFNWRRVLIGLLVKCIDGVGCYIIVMLNQWNVSTYLCLFVYILIIWIKFVDVVYQNKLKLQTNFSKVNLFSDVKTWLDNNSGSFT